MSEMQARQDRRARRRAMMQEMLMRSREARGGGAEVSAVQPPMEGTPAAGPEMGAKPPLTQEQMGLAPAPQPYEGSGLPRTAPERPGATMMVDEDRIREAHQLMLDYKAAKHRTDARIIRNQEWWRQRNWAMIEEERGTIGTQPVKTGTAWLKASIISKHADYMEAYPEPLFLARNAEDEPEAKHLSEILPVVLKQIGFEQTYSQVGWQMGVEGTGLYGVTWDGQASHGMGEICIRKINALNFYAEPGIEDVQDSSNVFCVRMEDDRKLEAMYPQLVGKLGRNTFTPNEYREIDGKETRGKSLVVDWYYKKWCNGKMVLHYCQYVGETILYASENDPATAETGYYDHGLYPFVPVPLLPDAGTMYGQSYIDEAYGTQTEIDIMSQAMVTNAVASATPRYFMRSDGAVNEDEFLDWAKPLVHVNGNLSTDTLMQVDVPKLDTNTLNMYQNKVEELKFVTGNTDTRNGDVPSSVTSGVQYAAMREDAGRTSKDTNRTSYRAMEQIYLMCVELIRQFYTMERQFRIVGEDGMATYLPYSNAKLQLQSETAVDGSVTYRLPMFDVDVHVQRENAYTRMAMNDLATQFYNMGIFDPMRAPQALAMLKMMEFKGKEQIVQQVQAGFMQTMTKMGGRADAAMAGGAPQQAQTGGKQGSSTPVEDDKTEAGKAMASAHTPAMGRMENRVNNAVRP